MTQQEMQKGFDKFMASAAQNNAKPETIVFICRDSNGSVGFASYGNPMSFHEQLGVLAHAQLALYQACAGNVTDVMKKSKKKTAKAAKKR